MEHSLSLKRLFLGSSYYPFSFVRGKVIRQKRPRGGEVGLHFYLQRAIAYKLRGQFFVTVKGNAMWRLLSQFKKSSFITILFFIAFGNLTLENCLVL